jgi:4-aminobutyrate aminotransferase-like enzyme
LAGNRDVIRILAPLVIDDEQLERGLAILRASTHEVLTR